MAEQSKGKKVRKRRPRQSSLHFTVWTMNGSPFPEEVLEQLEATFKRIADESQERLLSNVSKF